nr:aldo/keto reductase [Kineococcus siccus]
MGTAGFAFRPAATASGCLATVAAGLEAGVRLIDTAPAYTTADEPSWAETLVGRALAAAGPVPGLVVATKGGHHRRGAEFPVDARPEVLRRDCEASLRFLGVERLDLYQLHRVDPAVPLAESVGALAELRAQGKVAAVGLCNVTLAQLQEARRTTDVATVQNHLSHARAGDLATARACAATGTTYLAHTPFGAPGSPPPAPDDPRVVVAQRHGVSVQQVTLAWLAAVAPDVVPLVGCTRTSTLHDSLAAAGLALEAGDLALLGPGGTAGTWVRDEPPA